jgi:hypothetical protein
MDAEEWTHMRGDRELEHDSPACVMAEWCFDLVGRLVKQESYDKRAHMKFFAGYALRSA